MYLKVICFATIFCLEFFSDREIKVYIAKVNLLLLITCFLRNQFRLSQIHKGILARLRNDYVSTIKTNEF